MSADLWWFLLVPVVFGLGWFAARLEHRGSGNEGAALSGAYFKGLNFLLNEQPDKAIDAFVDVVRIAPETVELHFALGSLFRRRGETDRAIRVHQNLVERPGMTSEQREHALFELGQDYLKSGLLDRAEDAFNRLEGSPYRAAALRHRLQIAQMVSDWPLAIELAEQLSRDPGELGKSNIAHFYCEQAQLAIGNKNAAAASETVRRALDVEPKHPRPKMIRASLSYEAQDYAAAIDHWSELFEQSPKYAALVATEWLEAHRQLDKLAEGIRLLEKRQETHYSVDTLSAISKVIADSDGAQAASSYLVESLDKTPSILGYQQLLSSRLENVSESDESTDIALARRQIRRQADKMSRYICSHCGFGARRFYWRCPGCSHWDSYDPRRAEELENG